MIAEVQDPVAVLNDLVNLRFPPETEARMQHLMDRNTEGLLTSNEREELTSLVKLGHEISLLRGRAMMALGRKP